MTEFFPLWVVITHALNLFFMLLLARSGLEVLSAFPKLYWHESTPGRHWLKLSKRTFSAESRRPWTTMDEEVAWSPLIALPGRKNVGLGRRWHYLVPTQWSIVPDSLHSIGTYLQFEIPEKIPGEPFEPAQKLAYFLVIFVLSPLQILSGAAMSPSIIARFPWYGRLFGGRQGARSWHFIGLCLLAVFTVVHVFMVIVHGLPEGFVKIALAEKSDNRGLALFVGLGALMAMVLFHVAITWFSLRYRRRTQRLLGRFVNPFERVLSRTLTSRQHFDRKSVSRYHLVNGYPPVGEEHERLAADGFVDYRLDVGGLVERPMSLSLTQLREIGFVTQITKHNCIQGWTSVAEWGGTPLTEFIEHVGPTPEARHVVSYAMDDKGVTEGEGRFGYFYGTIPPNLARATQSMIAVEMNGGPLPVEHGAPVRLRVETHLRFKMVKWITAIEFVEAIDDIGQGQGGWREDQQYYANAAGI